MRTVGDPGHNGGERGHRHPVGKPRGPGLACFPESERAGAPWPGVAACGLQRGPEPAGRPVRKGTDTASALVETLRALVPPAESVAVSQAGAAGG